MSFQFDLPNWSYVSLLYFLVLCVSVGHTDEGKQGLLKAKKQS